MGLATEERGAGKERRSEDQKCQLHRKGKLTTPPLVPPKFRRLDRPGEQRLGPPARAKLGNLWRLTKPKKYECTNSPTTPVLENGDQRGSEEIYKAPREAGIRCWVDPA